MRCAETAHPCAARQQREALLTRKAVEKAVADRDERADWSRRTRVLLCAAMALLLPLPPAIAARTHQQTAAPVTPDFATVTTKAAVAKLARLVRGGRFDTVFSFLVHANAVAAAFGQAPVAVGRPQRPQDQMPLIA